MEILSRTESTGVFYFSMIIPIIFILLCLFASLSALIMMICERDFNFNDILGVILSLMLGVVFTFAIYVGYERGADVTYKAKVTDFNEVYNNGYKIVGQEDKIYILRKTK